MLSVTLKESNSLTGVVKDVLKVVRLQPRLHFNTRKKMDGFNTKQLFDRTNLPRRFPPTRARRRKSPPELGLEAISSSRAATEAASVAKGVKLSR